MRDVKCQTNSYKKATMKDISMVDMRNNLLQAYIDELEHKAEDLHQEITNW